MRRGYITVYLSLTLGILVSFIVTLLTGARIRTIRFQTECTMNIGLESIFAEYHRELLKQYGMLFIDSSYGTGQGDTDKTKNRLLYYLNLNFEDNKEPVTGRDLTAIHADNAILSGISYASDDRGEVLRYQIDRYMKVKYGIGYIPMLRNDSVDMNSLLDQYEEYESDRKGAGDEVTDIMNDVNSNLKEDEEPYSISNPADSVESMNGSNVLFYALGDHSELGFKTTDISELISHRSYRNGVGLWNGQNAPGGIDGKALLIRYMYDKCGYYDHEKEGSGLLYEMEYIIAGKESDMKNMEVIAGRIFKIRYAVNMGYLLSSGRRQAEAEAMALAATTAVGLPELTEAVKYTILFAWGYAESAKDLRILYDGHSLPIVKTDATWNTPLEQMVVFKSYLDVYTVTEGELDYNAFLDIFLAAESTEDITMRLMDIMEMDIRVTPSNGGFKMDDQIYQLIAEVNASSRYGYGCSIKRSYTYE